MLARPISYAHHDGADDEAVYWSVRCVRRCRLLPHQRRGCTDSGRSTRGSSRHCRVWRVTFPPTANGSTVGFDPGKGVRGGRLYVSRHGGKLVHQGFSFSFGASPATDKTITSSSVCL